MKILKTLLVVFATAWIGTTTAVAGTNPLRGFVQERDAGAGAAEGASSVASLVSEAVTGQAPLPGPQPVLVRVGPGSVDVSTHQIVRASSDRVYVFALELDNPVVHAYKSTEAGIPRGFREVDSTGGPRAAGVVSGVDAAIDGDGRVHVIWLDTEGPVNYQVFDTNQDRWEPAIPLADSGTWPNLETTMRQGSEGASLALDSDGSPHVVYTRIEDGRRHLWYRNLDGESWSGEMRLDDVPAYDSGHPALAFDGAGRLHVAWLVEQTGVNTGEIRIRSRYPDGTWDPASFVVDSGPNVYSDDWYAIDQGPSLIITADGTRHLAYIAGWERSYTCPSDNYQYGAIRYKYDDGSGWKSLDPAPGFFTHNPSLATTADRELFLFGHDDACLNPTAASMYYFRRPSGRLWGERTLLADGPFDSSVSTKWSWNFWNEPDTVEVVFWTQNQPNELYYAAFPRYP